jgi:multidrug efflux pump subunit AcrA (membrane-fusion protein)
MTAVSVADANPIPRGRFDVRRLSWRRATGFVIVAGSLGGTLTYVGDNTLVMNADGLVLSERIVAAVPYEARIKRLYVRSGDYVHAGDKLAVLESASMSRNLAGLAVERARLTTTIAQLEARRAVVDALFPIAKANGVRLQALVAELERYRERGMTSSVHLQQMTAEAYTAGEKLASLQAEKMSSEEQLHQSRAALVDTNSAYQDLKSMYASGELFAPVSGVVGATIIDSGEVITPGKKVLEIYTGEPFVMAYLPDGSVRVREGEHVQVHSASRRTHATVEKILPLAEALPPEFQKPVHARDRGQLLRVTLTDRDAFVTDQKVRVTGCYVADCADFANVAASAARAAARKTSDALRDANILAAQYLEEARALGGQISGWARAVYAAGLRRIEESIRSTEVEPPRPATGVGCVSDRSPWSTLCDYRAASSKGEAA